MENNNSTTGSGHGNNFFSGFLLGALIGAAIVLLFVTKKGKKILKTISEEGEGKISSILSKIESSVDLEDAVLEDDGIETVAPKREVVAKSSERSRTIEDKPASPRGEPKVRRFFRGISRNN